MLDGTWLGLVFKIPGPQIECTWPNLGGSFVRIVSCRENRFGRIVERPDVSRRENPSGGPWSVQS